MRKFVVVAVVSLTCTRMVHAQGRPLDWPFFGGDAQRTGWEKSDWRITKENIKDFQLVLKRKLDNKQNGPRSLTPPVVIGNLISYRGFKELAFVAGNSDNLWSIDADTDKIFWQKHFDYSADKPKPAVSASCSASVTAIPALTPPLNFAARPRAAGTAPPAPPPPGSVRALLGGGGFGAPRPAFAVSSDGKLHLLNTSNGADLLPAMNFLPANAKASSLTIAEGVVYTTTTTSCGGAPNAVWAIDLNGADTTVASFPLSGGVSELGGLSVGTDGTIYVQSANKVLALAPKSLELKQSFTASGGAGKNLATPVVFAYKDHDLIVSSGGDGRIYLLDTQSLSEPLSQTLPLSSGDRGVWGGLSSWQDPDGTRWVLAPVWGPVNSELKVPITNGDAPNGSVVAFKLDEANGKPVLTPAWVSRDMSSPQPPVITSGIVFALSAGEYTREERPKSGTHATLYALDGATGKEMYSTGNQVTTPGNLTGLTVANGRVYFTTNDSMLYAFGIFLER
jgi:outer membrane protein assembly factor BamB